MGGQKTDIIHMNKKHSQQTQKTLFDHLKHIISVQDPNYYASLSDSDEKTFSQYMIQRFLSMNVDWIDLVSYIDKYTQVLSNEQYYRMIISLIPRQDKTYYPYIKKKKEKENPKWAIELLSMYYKVSLIEADAYITLLKYRNKSQLIELLQQYGIEDKKLKTI